MKKIYLLYFIQQLENNTQKKHMKEILRAVTHFKNYGKFLFILVPIFEESQ